MHAPDTDAPSPPTLHDALKFWLRLGFISFGGPAGQIAILHAELVERRRWISERRFLHALNYCMVLPGPEAQQLATYLGWLMHRTAGGLLAGALFVLPSLAILIALSWLYVAFGHVPAVAGLFRGIQPAVAALVVQAAWRLGRRSLATSALKLIAAVAFGAMALAQVPFPALVAAAAAIGWLGGRFAPQSFRAGGGHGESLASHGPAVIDDSTPPPPHARFCWARAGVVAAAGAALWALPLAALAAFGGWHGTLAQMGWFFTKAALLTFGGAYAVLPYVFQGAVVDHQWLTAAQMLDGLAFGETTPGPLIMVVAFVGYVGGHGAALFGPDALFWAGAAAAAVATWFTFLPSFVFILLGGPMVEATHGDLGYTAPLAAISAAVVGAIADLALFFFAHVFWPQGAAGPFDMVAAGIAVAAAVALLRYRRGVIEVIAVCGAVGVVLALAGLR